MAVTASAFCCQFALAMSACTVSTHPGISSPASSSSASKGDMVRSSTVSSSLSSLAADFLVAEEEGVRGAKMGDR